MPVLATKELFKHFDGVKAVNKLSVEFVPGRITGLVGPNGSGKSTLLNLLSGLIPIDSGMVLIGEHTKLSKIHPAQMAALGVTRTFQEVRLFEQLSVLDNILVVLTERNLIGAFFEQHGLYHLDQVESLLKQVGLWGKRSEFAGSLSYGQRKLLEIARALGTKAEIYLFDEPFTGMFPEMRKIVTEVLKTLRAAGKTVILVEHDMDLIRELCDFVYVIDSGEGLAAGRPREVLNDKKVIEAYLGE